MNIRDQVLMSFSVKHVSDSRFRVCVCVPEGTASPLSPLSENESESETQVNHLHSSRSESESYHRTS